MEAEAKVPVSTVNYENTPNEKNLTEQKRWMLDDAPYPCPAAPGDGRGESPAVTVEGTFRRRARTRERSRSPRGCRLPGLLATPGDRRAAGIHNHCPSWEGSAGGR